MFDYFDDHGVLHKAYKIVPSSDMYLPGQCNAVYLGLEDCFMAGLPKNDTQSYRIVKQISLKLMNSQKRPSFIPFLRRFILKWEKLIVSPLPEIRNDFLKKRDRFWPCTVFMMVKELQLHKNQISTEILKDKTRGKIEHPSF